MDKTVAVKWMQGFDQKVEAEKDHLSELDTPIGDGVSNSDKWSI